MRYTKRQMEHMAFVATQPSLLLSEDWLEQDDEIKRLRAEVAWWAGEGQVDRPEIVEWKLLCGKTHPTSDDEKRITEISEMVRREHEDAPELRAEIERLRSERNARQLRVEVLATDIVNQRAEYDRLRVAATDLIEEFNTGASEKRREILVEILALAARIKSPPADDADDGPKPSHFLAFPCCSLLQKTEAETVAQNIMVICKRRGDRWGELTREDYQTERGYDGDFSHGELSYFDKVYPMIDSAAGAASFSSVWRS